MNYFEYQDFPKIDRSEITVVSSSTLQLYSNAQQLKNGVMPYEYASFEENAYITSNPKSLAPINPMLGALTKETTNENGDLLELGLTFSFSPKSYSFSGITIEFVNIPKRVSLRYARAGLGDISEVFYPTSKKQFFPFAGESVHTIGITITGTQNPHHFLGVTRVEFGELKIFDASNLIDANVITHYDIDGTTIQYDIAELTIFTGENSSDYLFQKKQPVVYKDADGKTLHKFYVESGENNDDATANLTAYDSISLLETEWLGGIYGFRAKGVFASALSTGQLIDDILADTGVEYEIDDDVRQIFLVGYIPVCTRRKALALICKGSNVRAFKKNGVIYFKKIDNGNSLNFTTHNIAENPSLNSDSKIGRITVVEHSYEPSQETVELYNWYLKQGENTMQTIVFDTPVYKILAYEIIGTDENGNDIVSEVGSQNVVFYHAPVGGGSELGDNNVCNHCIIKSCNTDNRVLIKGWKITDSKNDDVYYERTDMDDNAEYEEVVIEDVTIYDYNNKNGVVTISEEIVKTLYAIENQNLTQEFMVVETSRPNLGDEVTTPMLTSPIPMEAYNNEGQEISLSHKVKICEIEDNLSGVYRVVAK